VEIVWSRRARARLEEIRAYVAKDKPDAAGRLATRIVAVVEALRNHPNLGHVGAEPGIRELVIGGTPYVVLYSVKRTQVTITTIWHGAQSRKTARTRGRKAK
jgi:addiction module RelE/StbE family toxin